MMVQKNIAYYQSPNDRTSTAGSVSGPQGAFPARKSQWVTWLAGCDWMLARWEVENGVERHDERDGAIPRMRMRDQGPNHDVVWNSNRRLMAGRFPMLLGSLRGDWSVAKKHLGR